MTAIAPAHCPTCGAPLKKMPQRKTRCPACGDYMYLKYGPNEPREQRRLVGSKQAADIHSAYAAAYAAQRLVNDALVAWVRLRQAAKASDPDYQRRNPSVLGRINSKNWHGTRVVVSHFQDQRAEERIVNVQSMRIEADRALQIYDDASFTALCDGTPINVALGSDAVQTSCVIRMPDGPHAAWVIQRIEEFLPEAEARIRLAQSLPKPVPAKFDDRPPPRRINRWFAVKRILGLE